MTLETPESAPPAGENSAMWQEVLTKGHGMLRIQRWMMRALPRAPRCKMCWSPFAGLGGRVVRVAGFGPSRKNPQMCSRCLEEMPPGGAEVDVGVLFADVRGSTTLGERMEPAAYAQVLNRFYRAATQVLVRHDALIDKLIGDEVMALFVPGVAGPAYRQQAFDAGRELLQAVGYGSGEPWLRMGVGVHAGRAWVGMVGSEGVTDLTALGDTVNTTARLRSAADAGELLVSEELWGSLERADGGAPEQRVLTLRGREQPVPVRVLRV